MTTPQRVALDTDIGTDVDDLLAPATILGGTRAGCSATCPPSRWTTGPMPRRSSRVQVRPEFVEHLKERGGLGALPAAEVEQYQAFSGRPSVPHGVVAVLLCAVPALFTTVAGRISAVDGGPGEGGVGFTPDPGGPHRVVTDSEVPAIVQEMERRILAAIDRSGG